MIAIIDVGSGNIGSVKKVLDYFDMKSRVVSQGKDLKNASFIIFPGVGHFGKVMHNLKERGFDTILPNLLNKGIPYFGICVGLQILFESTEERWINPTQTEEQSKNFQKGLGMLKGKVVKFRAEKVPQIGWNLLENVKATWLESNSYVYFVNSFYAMPDDNKVIAATSFYNGNFTSAIESNNIKAVQFHPEKSGQVGMEIIRKVLKC